MNLTREQTDAVLAAAPGPAYLAVPGGPLPCPADTDGDGDCATCFRQPGIHGYGPPTEWVALTEPCETCDGDEGGWDVGLPPCPDCETGRQRFPITVDAECDCEWDQSDDCLLAEEADRIGGSYCDVLTDGQGHGTVTLGSAEVTEVLPVVDDLETGSVTLFYGPPRILRRNPPGPRFTFIDPIGTPTPGDYIAVIADIKDAGI